MATPTTITCPACHGSGRDPDSGRYEAGGVHVDWLPCTEPRCLAGELEATRHVAQSSWIEAIVYAPLGGGRGVLVLELWPQDGEREGRKLIYHDGEHGVPSYLVGLLLSGSPGRAFNRLLRPGRFGEPETVPPLPLLDYDSNPDLLTADLRASLEVQHG